MSEAAPLLGAGLDSLGATEMVQVLNDGLSIDMEPTALFDHPSVNHLVAHLASKTIVPLECGVGKSRSGVSVRD